MTPPTRLYDKRFMRYRGTSCLAKGTSFLVRLSVRPGWGTPRGTPLVPALSLPVAELRPFLPACSTGVQPPGGSATAGSRAPSRTCGYRSRLERSLLARVMGFYVRCSTGGPPPGRAVTFAPVSSPMEGVRTVKVPNFP